MFFATHVPADADLLASIRLVAAAPPLTHYAVEVEHGPRRILRGTIATFLA